MLSNIIDFLSIIALVLIIAMAVRVKLIKLDPELKASIGKTTIAQMVHNKRQPYVLSSWSFIIKSLIVISATVVISMDIAQINGWLLDNNGSITKDPAFNLILIPMLLTFYLALKIIAKKNDEQINLINARPKQNFEPQEIEEVMIDETSLISRTNTLKFIGKK